MFGSSSLVRLLGVDLKIHWTFWLLVGLIVVAPLLTGAGVAFAFEQAVFVAAVFAIVLCHEFGHILAARRFGIGTKDVTLLPIGGVARLERIPREPYQELVVALAGPCVNVVLAAALLPFVSNHTFSDPEGLIAQLASEDMLTRLFWVNLSMTVFNLLPAFPLDGGRVLRALLAMKLRYSMATSIAAGIGVAMAAMFGVLGVLTLNLLLVLVAVFVGVGAMQEASAAKTKEALDGVQVLDAMVTRFETLSPNDSLRHAAAKVLDGSQKEYPVVQDGMLLGLLTRAMILQKAAERGFDTPVNKVMERSFTIVSPNENLRDVLTRVAPGEDVFIPVFQGPYLVGLLTNENIAEYISIKSIENDSCAKSKWDMRGSPKIA